MFAEILWYLLAEASQQPFPSCFLFASVLAWEQARLFGWCIAWVSRSKATKATENRLAGYLCVKTSLCVNHSYVNEFRLQVHFHTNYLIPYERFCTSARFETGIQEISEMDYLTTLFSVTSYYQLSSCLTRLNNWHISLSRITVLSVTFQKPLNKWS